MGAERWLKLGLALALAALLIAVARPILEPAWLRNRAGHTLLSELTISGDDCSAIIPLGSAALLERARQFAPNSPSTLRLLLRLKGLTDRGWISANAGTNFQVSEAGKRTYRDPLLTLYSTRMSSPRTWDAQRCRAAWGAWTTALTEAAAGRWEAAVTQYQAGLGLAPGRVPAAILREYYAALARYELNMSSAATLRLAAAKYLALAGETGEAGEIFTVLVQDTELDARGRCVALQGVAGIKTLGAGRADIPFWLEGVAQAACAAEGTAPNQPERTLSQHVAAVNGTTDRQLIGFNLDEDLLAAGAEVMGLLYWQRADGSIEQQPFRQPNLFPNSAMSWLSPEGFDQCVPGYTEPDWVEPCASAIVSLSESGARLTRVGKLYNAPGEGPDSYLVSSSVALPAGRPLIVGGRWRRAGEFPLGQLGRMGANGEYAPILSLGRLPENEWAAIAGGVEPLAAGGEYVFWIRPRAGAGSGDLWFDDLFGFALPE